MTRSSVLSWEHSGLLCLAEYINFLANVTPDNQDEYMAQMRRFNLGIAGEADCPVFDGLFDYCRVCLGNQASFPCCTIG